jgi:hypothetical protein
MVSMAVHFFFIAEADIPIKLVARLSGSHELQHLLMEVDQVGSQRCLVSLRRRAGSQMSLNPKRLIYLALPRGIEPLFQP